MIWLEYRKKESEKYIKCERKELKGVKKERKKKKIGGFRDFSIYMQDIKLQPWKISSVWFSKSIEDSTKEWLESENFFDSNSVIVWMKIVANKIRMNY